MSWLKPSNLLLPPTKLQLRKWRRLQTASCGPNFPYQRSPEELRYLASSNANAHGDQFTDNNKQPGLCCRNKCSYPAGFGYPYKCRSSSNLAGFSYLHKYSCSSLASFGYHYEYSSFFNYLSAIYAFFTIDEFSIIRSSE